MNLTSGQLRQRAYEALQGKWVDAFVLMLVFSAIQGAFSIIPIVSFFSILLLPMSYGVEVAFLGVARGKKPDVEQLFTPFKQFKRSFGVLFLMGLYIVLWALPFIVPIVIILNEANPTIAPFIAMVVAIPALVLVVVKSLSYSMAVFIAIDDPNVSISESINQSKLMMDGHKTELFFLNLSFIGWAFLAMLTCGIGFLFLYPYITTANAEFYIELSGKTEQKEVVSSEIDDIIF